jgi:hypothetical protein
MLPRRVRRAYGAAMVLAGTGVGMLIELAVRRLERARGVCFSLGGKR